MTRYLLVLMIMLCWSSVHAQDNLLDELEEQAPEWDADVGSTFKGTRLINGQSVETRSQGVLEFVINHRFGNLNSGAYEFFGLDEANIRLALEYGITDRLYVGIGRSSFEKTFDGFYKYRLVQQKSKGAPISLTWFNSMTIETFKRVEDEREFIDRLAYTFQALIARKFSQAVSLQIMPTYVHYNTITVTENSNDLFSCGIGGRVKISKRVTINAEYFYQFDRLFDDSHNALAIGFDIETGGHVFQLLFTNSRAMVEKGIIHETSGDFFDGDIRFGFNISRAFQLKK